MKLSKSSLVLPLAGLLVIGGAGVAFAASSSSGSPTGGVIAAAPSASPAPSAGTTVDPGPGWRDDTLLSDVLSNLVTKGTITKAQSTAITDALAAERTARMTEAQQRAEQLRTFLADGVITREEFNQLPTDSPLRQVTTLMDDGKITLDELRSIGAGLMGGRGGFGFGGERGMHGMMGGGGWLDPDASPAPSTAPSTGG